jgi:Methyltransferase domain
MNSVSTVDLPDVSSPAPAPRLGRSASLCDFELLHQLETLQPKSVVDFGAGGGKNGRLIRQVLGKQCRIIAVEGFEPTVRHLRQLGEPYDEVHHALLQEWLASSSEHYDLAVFGDVLEHVPPRTVHAVIERALERFSNVIVVAPLHDLFQDDKDGNTLEIHRTYMTRGFFDRYRPLEQHVIYGSSYAIMNVLLARRRPTPLVKRTAQRVFHTTMLGLQPFGLARPLVEALKLVARPLKHLIR